MSDADAAISALARRQHSVFVGTQLAGSGVTRRMLQRRASSRKADGPGRRTSTSSEGPPSRGRGSSWASCSPPVRAQSSPIERRRRLWGLDGFRPGIPELTVPRGRRFRRAVGGGAREHGPRPVRDPPALRTATHRPGPNAAGPRPTHERSAAHAGDRVGAEAQADLMVRADRNAREARSLWAARDQEAAKSDRQWRPPGRDHRQRLRTSGALAAG